MKRIGFTLLVAFVCLSCWAGNEGDSIHRSRLSIGGHYVARILQAVGRLSRYGEVLSSEEGRP